MGCGSSFAVRYVSGGSLFLKPLGTSLTMPSKPLFVNRYVVLIELFPQDLWGLFLMSYGAVTVYPVWKNRGSAILFLPRHRVYCSLRNHHAKTRHPARRHR